MKHSTLGVIILFYKSMDLNENKRNQMLNDLVSVIICTYNRQELLRRAIISVKNQTYHNIEIIVSDDCSNYDITKFIKELEIELNIKIVLRINTGNKGACYTRNEGIKLAKGKYIAGLDDDDEFTPERISLLIENYDPSYSLITSNTLVVEKNKKYKFYYGNKNELISLNDSLWENKVGTQCLVEKKRILDLGGFDTSLYSAQDADMWIRLIERFGPALRIKEVTYVLHTEHDAPRITTSMKKVNGLISYTQKHSSKMNAGQLSYANFIISLWNNKKREAFRTLNLYSGWFVLKKIMLKMISGSPR